MLLKENLLSKFKGGLQGENESFLKYSSLVILDKSFTPGKKNANSSKKLGCKIKTSIAQGHLREESINLLFLMLR
jgi:hypothetical protein